MLAWARVYFYCVIGVTICTVFLVTPGKVYLQKQVKARSARPDLKRGESQESLQGATLGVPSEPGKEFDEMVEEIMEEIKSRQGSSALPDGQELRKRVEDALKSRTKEEKAQ
jgi:lysophospholipid acyltransferase